MPDLGNDAIRQWLADATDFDLPSDLEGHWPQDDPGVELALQRFGRVLDNLAAEPGLDLILRSPLLLGDLQIILSQLRPHQLTRLLAWFHETASAASQGALQRALACPTSDGAGQYLCAFLTEHERQRLLARIFADEPVGRLQSVCGRLAEQRRAA